jgi:hypothetical protein
MTAATEVIGALDVSASRYARAVTAALAAVAGDDLIAVYLYGSGATGRFIPTRSDLDLIVLVRDWLAAERAHDLVAEARAVRRPRSVKGLDLLVLPRSEAQTPRADPRYCVWILTSIDSEIVSGPLRPGDARLALLLSMCHQHAIALTGPEPRSSIGQVDSAHVVDAMRVDLGLAGAAGWYRVLNACRTLHYLETGRLCSRAEGAAWAQGRVPDRRLVDDALAWREKGIGPVLDPARVEAFVEPVVSRLAERSGTDTPTGVPVVEARRRVTVLDEEALVSCVLRAPDNPELLALAARRFADQHWWRRELIVLEPADGATRHTLPTQDRVRSVVVPPEDADEWASYAVAAATGSLIATWDATTWYATDRLRQQVRELLSTNAQRLVAPSVLGYDPRTRLARTLHDPASLESATLIARRHAWDQFGTPARRGERGDLAVRFGPLPGDEESGDAGSLGDIAGLLGSLLETYAVAAVTAAVTAGGPPAWTPAVSCLMPTYNRRPFVARAIRYYQQQDYPERELLILDDGEDRVEDLVPADDPSIRYLRLDDRATIGRKRQIACEHADGEVMVQWDDDDWFGPTRVGRQVAPLAAGTADISGILKGYLLDLTSFRFFGSGPPLHEGQLHAWIVAGTLAFTRHAWLSSGGYPDCSIGEEIALLRRVVERGGRVASIVNDGMYMTVRHSANSWRLYYDSDRGPGGWTELAPPDFLPAADLGYYRTLR